MYTILKSLKFRPFLPVKIIFGTGSINSAGKLIKKIGTEALIVIGRGSIRTNGYLDILTELLKNASIDYKIYEGIGENPTVAIIDKGGKLAREFGCNVVIGFGGGSVMDATKGISIVAKNSGSIWDYISFTGKKGKRIENSPLPIIEIPTVSASGSEANGGAVITNERTREKAVLINKYLFPKFSIVDPSLTVSVPLNTTIFGGVDILCHILERYVTSTKGVSLTDKIQEYLMKIVVVFLPMAVRELDNIHYREMLSFASTLACSRFPDIGGGSGDMTLHALEHPISAFHPDIPHGAGLASLLPAYLENVCDINGYRCKKLAKTLFSSKDLKKSIKAFLEEIGAFTPLNKLGVKKSEIPLLIKNAKRTGYWLNTHPKPLTDKDIFTIYQNSF